MGKEKKIIRQVSEAPMGKGKKKNTSRYPRPR